MAALAVLMPAQKGKSTCPGRKYPRFFVSEEERTFEIKPWGIYRKTIWLF